VHVQGDRELNTYNSFAIVQLWIRVRYWVTWM